MYFSIITVLIQIVLVSNDKSDCGCNINNERDDHLWKSSNEESSTKCSSRDNGKCFYNENDLNENMVIIPEGLYQMGTDDIVIENDKEGPMKMVKVKSFYMDKYEVSNTDFMRYAKATDYKTEAEIFGDSFVFSLFLNNTFREQLKDFRVVQAPWWYKVLGANWKHPQGPDSDILDLMEHPVVHVSWRDAKGYCKWRGARLPTEEEWEAACRGGHNNTLFPWGDKLLPNKKYMANIWQGTFPNHNSVKDGYIGTNPVQMFVANDFGLYNMAGNVWEWVENGWSNDNPQDKVKKGGSYLCHKSYCYRYRCSARSHNTEDSSSGNLGFRCAKSIA
ncbi:hypothetical protein ACJJTC_008885 [Scirpophaga incertulas]